MNGYLNECVPNLYDDIEACAKGNEGTKLLMENGVETTNLTPKLTYVPWITVNGEFNSKVH